MNDPHPHSYYEAIDALEPTLPYPDTDVLVDGQRETHPRRIAARLIVEGKAQLAPPKET